MTQRSNSTFRSVTDEEIEKKSLTSVKPVCSALPSRRVGSAAVEKQSGTKVGNKPNVEADTVADDKEENTGKIIIGHYFS